ncbi:MAG: isochorismatase family protein [Methylohalobius sp. ZOD2]|nr:isochorismatase family protein [Methylothermaceae bacterium]
MAHPPILCDAERSILVLTDIQPRLAEAMPEHERQRMIDHSNMLLEAAGTLDVPVLITEQYPEGLGHTTPEISKHLPAGVTPLPKTGFACNCAEGFDRMLDASGRTQVILTGQETHVCVLQTAFALLSRGLEVFVVEDAVCSRNPEHKIYALERMRQAGGVVLCAESVLFEWLRDARHPHFKSLARLIR